MWMWVFIDVFGNFVVMILIILMMEVFCFVIDDG